MNDVKRHAAEIKRTLAILAKLVVATDVDETALPELLKAVGACETEDTNIKDWASKFGFWNTEPKTRKRKRGVGA